jgi:hypothetical protein
VRGKAADTDEFNTYLGPVIRRGEGPHPSPATTEQAIRPWLDHVRTIVCCNSEQPYEWVLSWLASTIQRPWFKTAVTLVMQGHVGLGKGVMLDPLRAILGRAFKTVHCADDVLGDFTGMLEGGTFVLMDETIWAGDKRKIGKLKALITEQKHRINRKHVATYYTDSYLNIVMATNSAWVVPAGSHARRYCVLNCDNKWAGPDTAAKTAYFAKVRGVDPALIARFLYTRDLSQWNPRQLPPTNGLQQQQEHTMTGVEQWWYQVLNRSANRQDGSAGEEPARLHPPAPQLQDESKHQASATDEEKKGDTDGDVGTVYGRVWLERGKRSKWCPTETLHSYFTAFAGRAQFRRPNELNTRAFVQQLTYFVPGILRKRKAVGGTKRRGFTFPSLEDARRSFERAKGASTWEWGDESEYTRRDTKRM